MKSRGPPDHAEEHGLVSQIAGDLKLGEGSSTRGFYVAEEELRLELDGARPPGGEEYLQVSKKPASRQAVRTFYSHSHFLLLHCT